MERVREKEREKKLWNLQCKPTNPQNMGEKQKQQKKTPNNSTNFNIYCNISWENSFFPSFFTFSVHFIFLFFFFYYNEERRKTNVLYSLLVFISPSNRENRKTVLYSNRARTVRHGT